MRHLQSKTTKSMRMRKMIHGKTVWRGAPGMLFEKLRPRIKLLRLQYWGLLEVAREGHYYSITRVRGLEILIMISGFNHRPPSARLAVPPPGKLWRLTTVRLSTDNGSPRCGYSESRLRTLVGEKGTAQDIGTNGRQISRYLPLRSGQRRWFPVSNPFWLFVYWRSTYQRQLSQGLTRLVVR